MVNMILYQQKQSQKCQPHNSPPTLRLHVIVRSCHGCYHHRQICNIMNPTNHHSLNRQGSGWLVNSSSRRLAIVISEDSPCFLALDPCIEESLHRVVMVCICCLDLLVGLLCVEVDATTMALSSTELRNKDHECFRCSQFNYVPTSGSLSGRDRKSVV